MKRLLSLFVSLTIILGMTGGFVINASVDESGYAWVLVDTYSFPIPEYFKPGDPWSYYASIEGNTIEVKTSIPYGLGVYASKDYNNPGNLHAKYTWSNPPSVIQANENVTITLEQEVISNRTGNYSIGFSPFFNMDVADLGLGFATASKVNSKKFYSDGSEAKSFGVGYNQDDQSQSSFTASMTLQFRDKGSEGQKCALYVGVYAGSPGSIGVRYTYEWKQTGVAMPAPSTGPVNLGTYSLKGEWDIDANGYKGKLNITKQQGSRFIGTINIDSERTDDLTNGSLSGSMVTFTRQWSNNSFNQVYTGTLTTAADGKMIIEGTFISGSATYKWSAVKSGAITTTPAAPATTAPTAGSGAEVFESGSRIMWQPSSGLGYRLFRSTSKSDLGISVTDFYITSTSYADVNVESNTTYYYSVKPVLAEARPFEGIEEKLGNVIATFTVKTGNQTYKPGSYKHFIMLKLESPNMSVDGINQEVDPGRGTTPLVIAGRTMVPIRAVVEAMSGTVEWDGSTQKITLKARGNTVVMWMGNTDITVNGASKKMDVAPASKNNRTFVPVRFAAENLNCKVDWINSTKEAVIVYEE